MGIITYQPSWVSNEVLAKAEKAFPPLPANVPMSVCSYELFRRASQFQVARSISGAFTICTK